MTLKNAQKLHDHVLTGKETEEFCPNCKVEQMREMERMPNGARTLRCPNIHCFWWVIK